MAFASSIRSVKALVLPARARFRGFVRDYGPALRRFEGVEFALYALVLVGVSALVSPWLGAGIPELDYEAPIVFLEILERERDALTYAMRAQQPGVAGHLLPFLPTALLLLAKKRIRWEGWEAGAALRGLIMVLVGIVAWAAALFDYNMYLDTGHLWDRLLLLALALLSWKFPLAIPFFATHALVMLREVTVPLYHDDFDYRPVIEVLFLFSSFVWLSFLRGLRTKHFVFVALCLVGAYYYEAGVSKLYYGEKWSWLRENHVSNLSFSAYTHGWLGFVPERWFLSFVALARKLDFLNQAVTLFVAELGAIVLIHLHPRLTRIWLWCAALLHVGIFVFSGVFFWKWIVLDLALWHFLRRGGADVHRQLFKSWMIPVLGIALIYTSGEKKYFNPQVGVGWYDTRVSEVWEMQAVGVSGKKYPLNARFFAPYDTRLIQGDYCFLSSADKRLTGVYGSTASLALYRALEAARTKQDVDAVAARFAGSCYSERAMQAFDKLVGVTFANVNRARGKKHHWLHVLGRPDHLRGDRFPPFEFQEPIRKVEVWRVRKLYDGQSFQDLGSTRVHEVAVP